MYTATVPITITTFNPITPKGPTIAATLSALNNTSPQGSGGSKVFTFTPATGKITVNVPKGYAGAVQITYQLSTADYILLGVSVQPSSSNPSGSGRQVFRTIIINRDPSSSQMTVTDSCSFPPGQNKLSFDYYILVQRASDGAIGVIDPDIDNEGGD